MTLLFRRAGKVQVGTIELVIDPVNPSDQLDLAFSVQRTSQPEPNTAEVQIRNLNADSRASLEELDLVPVQIEAGYEDQTSQLFLGFLRSVFTVREGPTLITTISAGDSEDKYQKARLNTPVGVGGSNLQVMQVLIKAIGVGEGNLASVTPALLSSKPLFPNGTVLTGQASQVMNRLTRSLGLEWTIQNGALQLLQTGAPLVGTAVLLTPDTGLVGSPSVDNKGVLNCQTLLIPDVFPGRQISLDTERVSGNYRVEVCNYSGDTAGNDWYIDIEAKKL